VPDNGDATADITGAFAGAFAGADDPDCDQVRDQQQDHRRADHNDSGVWSAAAGAPHAGHGLGRVRPGSRQLSVRSGAEWLRMTNRTYLPM
jgi:hypothetical protein